MSDDAEQMRPIDSTSVQWALRAVFALAVVHGAVALATYSWLPERIPIHFDAAGRPDGFAAPGLWSWFSLWFVSGGLGALMTWISLRIDLFPLRYVNLPRKEEVLGLPPAARSRIMAHVSFHVLVMTGIIMAFMLGLHACIALHIRGMLDRLPVAMIAAGIALPLLYTVVMIVRIHKTVSAEIDSRVSGKK